VRALDKQLLPHSPCGLSKCHPYLIKSLLHATDVLGAFQHRTEALRLRDIMDRTGFRKAKCFRLLYTLHQCGFLEKTADGRYQPTTEIHRRRRYRIGYAALGQDSSFPREVRAGLVSAAEREQLQLIVVDNRYDAKVALRNAQHLIRESVDLAIEFQADEAAASAIASVYMRAGIPLIAIDIPHSGATYFGANNYEAGLLAGRHLGKWAREKWAGEVDEILLLEIARAGSVPRARLRGVAAGIRETVREAAACPVMCLDGDGQFGTSLERVRRHLRASKAQHVLVGAANDSSALGAARAFEEAGRAANCAIVGQNAEPDARAELRRPRTPLIASVGYFPERYGEALVRLALDILARREVPPAVFVRHQVITAENLEHFYPNDSLFEMRWDPPLESIARRTALRRRTGPSRPDSSNGASLP
jgi:ribose transport system substrate-binding protein